MLARDGSSAPPSDGQARLESLQQDIKFINNLLSQTGLEAPFPFSSVATDNPRGGSGGSELHNLEQAVSTLITLLNSKQVGKRVGWDGLRPLMICPSLERECL